MTPMTHLLAQIGRSTRRTLAGAVLFVLSPAAAFAQLPGIYPPERHALPSELTRSGDLKSGIRRILNFALTFVGIITIIIIIYAGFLYIADRGEGANTKKAKAAMGFAAIGIVLILLSYVIANFILVEVPGAITTGSGDGGIGFP